MKRLLARRNSVWTLCMFEEAIEGLGTAYLYVSMLSSVAFWIYSTVAYYIVAKWIFITINAILIYFSISFDELDINKIE